MSKLLTIVVFSFFIYLYNSTYMSMETKGEPTFRGCQLDLRLHTTKKHKPDFQVQKETVLFDLLSNPPFESVRSKSPIPPVKVVRNLAREKPKLMLNMLYLLASPRDQAKDQRSTYLDFIRVDQRPPLVGSSTAADSLYGRMEESLLANGIAESHREELEDLVHRFAPTLVLPKGDYVKVNGKKYQLIPCDVSPFADTLRLDMIRAAPYRFQDFKDIPFHSLPVDSLTALVNLGIRYESDPNLLMVWYFDFPGDNPQEWWEVYGKFRSGPDSLLWAQPTVYAHPFLDSQKRVIIQYWYFFPINDFIGNHEGDWEHINVIVSSDRARVEEVHYYFHARSVNLPQGKYKPEMRDGTHPVVYMGGRAYMIVDYPIRFFTKERNSGSHGCYPYAGEWEGAMGLAHTESVSKPDKDSTRVIPYHKFRVILTPEPTRIDYKRRPEVLKEWAWLLLPVRWGFPSAPSFGMEIKLADVGNRAPFGPAFNPAWNRTAPGLTYPAFQVRKITSVRSIIEDLLQPWYYLYIFRFPRFVHDTRGALSYKELIRLGLFPRTGWQEKGFGTAILGTNIGFPTENFRDSYGSSVGISLWRNFWAKIRFGALEFLGGYQKFQRKENPKGSLFVYPITVNLVIRAPENLFRPYGSIGVGAYGWESRIRLPNNGGQLVSSGWNFGWIGGVGIEYYLRPWVAFDVGVRYHLTNGPGAQAGIEGNKLRFITVWAGHYLRF